MHAMINSEEWGLLCLFLLHAKRCRTPEIRLRRLMIKEPG